MTPKDKAIELYNKFLNPSGDTYLYGMLEHDSAKECALICCSEVLGYMGADRGYQYWTEVKQEIEKL
jgi:hypothetical protein